MLLVISLVRDPSFYDSGHLILTAVYIKAFSEGKCRCLLKKGRETGQSPSKRLLCEETMRTEDPAIGRRTLKPCIFPCRPLAVSVYDRNPARMGSRADNKEKMPKDRKNDNDAGCLKPAKVKE